MPLTEYWLSDQQQYIPAPALAQIDDVHGASEYIKVPACLLMPWQLPALHD